MECLNFYCKNEISGEGLTHKFSKYNLCTSCRKKKRNIMYIKCFDCGTQLLNCVNKLRCNDCRIKRRNMKQLAYKKKWDKLPTSKILKREYGRKRRGFYEKRISELIDMGYTVIPPKTINEGAISIKI